VDGIATVAIFNLVEHYLINSLMGTYLEQEPKYISDLVVA
jgi:hypothetical protein